MFTKQNRLKNFWVDRGTEFAGESKNYAKLKEYKFTLQWVLPRLHLLNVQYDPWKLYFTVTWKTMDTITFTKWFSSLQHEISRRNCPIDLSPKNDNNSDFLSILYSKPLREVWKPKFKTRDRVRVSKYDLPFRKCYKLHFTQEVFEIVEISSRKPPTYTIKDEQDENILGKFYQREFIKVN